MDDKHGKARRRALRAAQVVTIALSLGTGGCASDTGGPSDAAGDTATGDTSMMSDTSVTPDAMADAAPDATADATPDGAMDATVDGAMDGATDAFADATPDAVADATLDAACTPPHTTRPCCEADPFGFWDETTGTCIMAVPGPFVPPAMA